jgi:hypothetical protein
LKWPEELKIRVSGCGEKNLTDYLTIQKPAYPTPIN